MMLNMPVIAVLFSLSWVVGMVIFANYADCDPLTLGYISKFDEIVPFFVEDKFVNMPGLLGLVMATLFNSALTIAVSNLNSLATVTFEDFLSQIPAFKDLKDTQQLRTIKIIAVVYGFLIIGCSFLVGMLSGVIESSMLMTSATSGPLLGVFVLAMLVPCANWKGASAGMIFSHITTIWITFGRLSVIHPVDETLPLSVDGCNNDTFSPHVMPPYDLPNRWEIVRNVSAAPAHHTTPSGPLESIYGITYMYYALIGSLTTVVVGIIVSLLTADAKGDAYEEHLLHPIALRMSKAWPGKMRLYESSTRLENDHTTATPPTGEVGKCSSQAETLENGKTQLSNSYMQKLNALRGVSLDVTSEITKGTKL